MNSANKFRKLSSSASLSSLTTITSRNFSMPASSSSSSLAAAALKKNNNNNNKNNNIAAAFQLSPRLDGLDKPTVWHEFSPLANEHNAVNLGQGFPDWDPPSFAIEAMMQSTDPKYGRNANQYARSYAHLPLAHVLAEDYSQRWNRSIDPTTEIATAVGCTNALYCALQGMISPGEEVLLFEPAFDVYIAQTKMAGGTPKYVPLRRKDASTAVDPDADATRQTSNAAFTLNLEELENAITEKTKVMIINSPHNPTGKMFSMEELTKIAEIVERHPQLTVISDEVYEHIVFDEVNSPHISFASIDHMYDRTLTLSSSGKTFSATGWKVGWAVGPPHLTKAVSAVQQWVNFSVPTPNQDAIALCLAHAREPYQGYDSFYKWIAAEYKRKRSLLADALITANMDPIVPDGGFFIMADTSKLKFPQSYREEITPAMPSNPMPRDWALSRWMTKVVGVTAIPPSAFYDTKTIHLAQNMLRFAYCKGDDTILKAHERFREYFD
eukprot:CAMPEP_0184859842 /NCGR_PEP_ID=MMETSP0580-20130426/4817_1 /TAXON_ID=1118495 /ORGANISM="Dactyliosolen fragilissimus" /LENGTH=496 /DNA_ID=CAMNT_0027356689 /DNA_START=25 /DNA_END=1515 /DNA_ORIENTATION=+